MVRNNRPQTDREEVPKFPGLICREGRYIYRARLPKDLVGKVKGKYRGWGKGEVKYALGTSDRKEALKRAKYEALKLDHLFEEELKRLRQENGHMEEIKAVSTLSEPQVIRLLTSWFLNEEERFAKWYDENRTELDSGKRQELISTLGEDLAAYDGAYFEKGESLNLDKLLNQILKEEGIALDETSQVREKLNKLLHRGLVELDQRKMDWLTKGKTHKHDDYFWKHVQPHQSKAKEKQQIRLEELFTRFLEDQKRAGRAIKTLDSYTAPMNAMRAVLGEQTFLSDITRDDIARLADFLHEIPSNATKKFPRKSLSKIVKLIKHRDDVPRISKVTAKNYYKNILAVFNYAVDTRLISENPANDRFIRESFKSESHKKEIDFTIDELNQIFHAPLYTGCIDDRRNYFRIGNNHPRKARFWIPLICLFQGMRMNEACQLYTEDIVEQEGYLCFDIRTDSNESTTTEKRLKNKASIRQVPVHEELLKMGFQEYVQTRREDQECPRLFPELTLVKGRENYSEKFSAWFSSFLKHTFDEKPQATFHSFRHMWRNELRNAEVGIELAEALGGWKEKRSSEARYGKGFSMNKKADALQKVQYEGLDICDLYVKNEPF